MQTGTSDKYGTAFLAVVSAIMAVNALDRDFSVPKKYGDRWLIQPTHAALAGGTLAAVAVLMTIVTVALIARDAKARRDK